MNDTTDSIRLHRDSPHWQVPADYVGPLTLPGNGRKVWWTGRVAIGLRHQPPQHNAVPGQSALWIQSLLLGPGQAPQVI
jgi:hypothetical protein